MDGLEHLQGTLHVRKLDALVHKLLLRDGVQGLGGPLVEPIDGAAIDKRREHAQAVPEAVAHGGEGQCDMHILLHPHQVGAEQIGLRWLHAQRLTERPARRRDGFEVLVRVEVRDIAAVQNVVDCLDEVLLDDLRVAEQENVNFVFDATLHQALLQIVFELDHAIALCDLNLEAICFVDEGGQARQALAAAPANTQQQDVPAGLIQHSTNAGAVLASIQEHHQRHHDRVDVVVVVQILFDRLLHLLHVWNFLINTVVHLLCHEGCENQAVGLEDLFGAHSEVIHDVRLDLRPHPREIALVGQAIPKDPLDLVAPASGHRQGVIRLLGAEAAQAQEHLPNVPQVEQVVRLRRRGQQVFQGLLEHRDRRGDHARKQSLDLFVERREEVRADGLEDMGDRRLRQVRVRCCAVVALQSLGDEGATASRRSHGRHHDDVHDVELHELLAIEPPAVIMPLPDELDGRLRPIVLLQGHVQVVDEQQAALAERRPIGALSPFVHLAIDDVLRLVGACLCAERNGDRHELVLVEVLHQLLLDDHRLPCARQA
mmetsp:Transcript_24992/g.71841  ORF Transcript_24992/g.71841 Transcript_24992/m.71841 type:complete len:543 (-) Transcript_24992:316-1944(-)